MSNVYKNAIYLPTTTANTTVYTCNATARAVIQTIQVTNQSGSHVVEVFIYDSSATTTTEIAHVSLGSNSTENIAKGPIILEEGDALLISAASTVVRGIVSILEVNRGSLTN
jgi:capsular polysaccharide biosynthesis protein